MSTDVKSCPGCNASLSADSVFCSSCGTYQGQPGVDQGMPRPHAKTPITMPADIGPWTGSPGSQTEVRPCPYCGAAVSTIATACSSCFRGLTPSAPLSGPELKKPSRGLVWFFMLGAVLLIVLYVGLQIVSLLVSNHPIG